ncbi:hypothetical protein sphantq_04464 (plasmid) [Sphingobium sp. AntQ-1]|nr:hypothetical protein sphantq_04464 [Sphingobium sp. AntQ-1]
MTKEVNTRRVIQSVGTGLEVLTTVAAFSGPCSLSAIAQGAQLSPSQTHRYLGSLMSAGMVKQNGSAGLYELDAGAIRLGLAALSRLDVFANAETCIADMVERTRRTFLVTVMGAGGPTVVRWYPGSPPVITSLAIGGVLPLFRSATGLIFYALGDAAEMERQRKLHEMTDPSAVPVNLTDWRAEIEQTLVTTISGDLTPGLRAVACPVFDLQGRLPVVVTMLANGAFPPSDDTHAISVLQAGCRSLTESIGGKWPISRQAAKRS